jgi:glycosyltransferase involved in cell wall biosynthesis
MRIAYASQSTVANTDNGSEHLVLGGPMVSIIIPTFNEGANIGRLLDSVRSQSGVGFEVIVVDQGSYDRTVEIAKSYGCTVVATPRANFYSPPGRNRNVGAAISKGSILLHLDADMELAGPHFLERLVGLIDDTHQAAVIHEVDIAYGFWTKCKALERSCYWNTEVEAARAMTKSLFDKVGGYHDEISSGEDFYLSKKCQLKTNLIKDSSLFLFHHTAAASLLTLLKKKFSYGKTAGSYIRISRGSGMDSRQRMTMRYLRAYIANSRLLVRDPTHFSALLPLRLMEVTAVCLGMLVNGAKSRRIGFSR